MSERLAAEIWIGGKVKASLVPDLCAAIIKECLGLEWGDYGFQPTSAEDLRQAAMPEEGEVALLHLQNDQARWGEFEDLERFLREAEIPFTRRSEGRYDADPEKVEYRPGLGMLVIPTDSAGELVVRAAALEPVQAALIQAVDIASTGSPSAMLAALNTVQKRLGECLPSRVPPLEPFEIVSDKVLEVEHGQ